MWCAGCDVRDVVCGIGMWCARIYLVCGMLCAGGKGRERGERRGVEVRWGEGRKRREGREGQEGSYYDSYYDGYLGISDMIATMVAILVAILKAI